MGRQGQHGTEGLRRIIDPHRETCLCFRNCWLQHQPVRRCNREQRNRGQPPRCSGPGTATTRESCRAGPPNPDCCFIPRQVTATVVVGRAVASLSGGHDAHAAPTIALGRGAEILVDDLGHRPIRLTEVTADIYGVWCLTWPSAMSTSTRRPAPPQQCGRHSAGPGLPDRRLHEKCFTFEESRDRARKSMSIHSGRRLQAGHSLGDHERVIDRQKNGPVRPAKTLQVPQQLAPPTGRGLDVGVVGDFPSGNLRERTYAPC